MAALLVLLCPARIIPAQEKVAPKPIETGSLRLRQGQAGSQQELDGYSRIHNEFDPMTKRSLIDAFARDYPESGLLAYVFQEGVYLGRQVNNTEMIAEYGEKSLELWSDNYTLLTELGSVYVQRGRIAQAEVKALLALDLIAAAEKPATMGERQWSETRKILLSGNCITLGYVHLRRAQASRVPDDRKSDAEIARSWFARAQQQQPNDDFTFYGLGFACMILNDYPNAEASLAKAVVLNGVATASARTLLEEIYRSRHNQSLDGLEQVLLKARTDLGI
jgi:hypothetical protein